MGVVQQFLPKVLPNSDYFVVNITYMNPGATMDLITPEWINDWSITSLVWFLILGFLINPNATR